MYLRVVLIFMQIWKVVKSVEIALISSSGCPSHDMRMIEMGKLFPDDNITWIQIRQYDFGFGPAKIEEKWRDFFVEKVDLEGQLLQENMKKLMWFSNVPVNMNNPMEIRGVKYFIKILQKNHVYCMEFLSSQQFKTLVQFRKFDLIMVDHVFQECLEILASLFNTTTIRFSGWPITDGYITSMNLPAPPSYIPKYSTPLPGVGMKFFERLQNTIFHMLIVLARTLQSFFLKVYYGFEGHFNKDLFQIESKQLFYIGGLEFLLEPIRPINNRIKHFGCLSCQRKDSENFWPKKENFSSSVDFIFEEGKPFVLVTFGSIMKIKEMPEKLLNTFLRTFSKLNKTVIWQANTDVDWISQKRSVPYNVYFVRWLPMKRVLAHKNLQYVVSLAGSNTVNELMHYGVPIVGIPLHSDQPSNMRHLVELGVGQMITRSDLWSNNLLDKIFEFEENYRFHKSRAIKISSMIKSYHIHTKNHEKFWLEWSIRHGFVLGETNRKFFQLEYQNSWMYFLVEEISFCLICLGCLIFCCK